MPTTLSSLGVNTQGKKKMFTEAFKNRCVLSEKMAVPGGLLPGVVEVALSLLGYSIKRAVHASRLR